MLCVANAPWGPRQQGSSQQFLAHLTTSGPNTMCRVPVQQASSTPEMAAFQPFLFCKVLGGTGRMALSWSRRLLLL